MARYGWGAMDEARGSTRGSVATPPGPFEEIGLDLPCDVDATGYQQVIRAFGDVASMLGSDHELDDLLHLIARKICELLELRRCSVYLRAPDSSLFRGQVGHAARNIDPQVKRLIAGVEADRFTQEIVRTKKPVLLRDARADPRAIRSTMRAWKVQAMLGVPMLLRGEVMGILFIDNEERPHPFTPADQDLAATFGNLAAIAIGQAQLTAKLRMSIRTAAHQNQLLRRAAEVDDRLTRLVLDGANLREIAQAVSELTGKPCAIADAAFRCRALAGPLGLDLSPVTTLLERSWADAASVKQALAGLSQRVTLVGPLQSEGLSHRLVIAPVRARDECWGYLVVAELGNSIGDMDTVLVGHAATIVALEVSAERRAANAENDALESLASDLIRGTRNDESLDRRAEFLGVRLAKPHVLCLIPARECPEDWPPTARRVRSALAPIQGLRVLTTGVAEGVLAILELPADLQPRAAVATAKEMIEAACRKLAPESAVTVAISGICRGPRDYVRAYGEVKQVAECIDAFCPAGELRILAADDLGVGRLLLGSATRDAANRFVDDTLARLLAADDQRSGDLLATLQVFFACSRSVRQSAAQLDVHENTIRYRLSLIEKITGLAVATDAADQLAAQVSLLVLQLQGRLPDVVAGSLEEAPAPAVEH
jgi:sugar diacid utilization regulator